MILQNGPRSRPEFPGAKWVRRIIFARVRTLTSRFPDGLKRHWGAWLMAGVLMLTLLGGERGLIRLLILNSDRNALKREIVQMEKRDLQLQGELASLSSPSFTMEKRIRETLDWVKKGETVYKFSDR